MNAELATELAAKLAKWKNDGEPASVLISNSRGKAALGEVYVQSWEPQARTKRAAKWLLGIWGVGAFCILFPIIHFILPPALFVAGPIVAFMLAQQSSVVLGGSGECPTCGSRFEIVRGNYLKPMDQWPLTDLCSSCREDVIIERVLPAEPRN